MITNQAKTATVPVMKVDTDEQTGSRLAGDVVKVHMVISASRRKVV